MNKNLNDSNLRDHIYKKYNGHCAYCGCQIKRNDFHIDHIKALRRGERDKNKKGSNDIENYNPSCCSCNSSKSVLSVEQWRDELLLKIKRINIDSAQYRILKRFGLVEETNGPIVFYFEKHKSFYEEDL